jgi:ferric-chelate reductase
MARAVSLGYGAKDNEAITGVLVGLCGPVGLRDEVVQIVGRVDPGKRDAVGGVEIYEE